MTRKKGNFENQINKNIFIPYYIAKDRLLDIYAILNNGLEEYQEITNSKQLDNKKKDEKNTQAGVGFSIIKIGANFDHSKELFDSRSNQIKSKKVQTLSSILNSILFELDKSKILIKNTDDISVGQFAEIPVHLNLNSMRYLSEEFIKINKLTRSINKTVPDATHDIQNIKKLFTDESLEVVYEDNNYGVVGHIKNENLYKSSVQDLLSPNLICFCQIKEVHNNGCSLLINDMSSRFNIEGIQKSLENMIDTFNTIDIKFSGTIKSQITGKKVYIVEIIALYNKFINNNQ